MEATALQWWTSRQAPCPRCGAAGIPVLLDMVDEESREAVRTGLAALGGCGLGGSGNDHECPACRSRFNVG